MGDTAGIRGSCAICQSTFISSSKIAALQCGHTFHFSCISQWLGVKKECPNCRKKLNPKSGIIEKLFFDIPTFDGEQSRVEINYQEKSEELAEKLGKEKESREELEKNCEAMKSKIKSLERKVIKEKEKYEKDVPALRTRNQHLEMLSIEIDGLRKELERSKAKLKACEFYQLLSYQNGEENVSRALSKYLKGNMSLDTEKFFELMKRQNKELAMKRKEAVQQAESLKREIGPLKKEVKEKDGIISELKKEIGELREKANVDTPINKRLRSVLMAETPARMKRVSMGFDQSSLSSEISFCENKHPESNSTITVDDSDEEESMIFKKLDRKRKRTNKNDRTVIVCDDDSDEKDFSFDIDVPSAVLKRVPLKPSKTLKRLNFDYTSPIESCNGKKEDFGEKKKMRKTEPKTKSARISGFFTRQDPITIDQ